MINELFPETLFPRKNFTRLDAILRRVYKAEVKLNGEDALKDTKKLSEIFSFSQLVVRYPSEVIQIYENLIWNIIRKHCFNAELHADLFQEIVLELMQRKFQYIHTSYDGSAPFTPYFATIIMRVCFDKQTKMVQQTTAYDDSIDPTPFQKNVPEIEDVIELEFNDLERILSSLNNKKLLYTFKYIHKLRIEKLEIKTVFPLISRWDIERCWSVYKSQQNLLTYLCKLFNKYERKHTKEDSLRRLLDLYLKEIYLAMNALKATRTYTKKSIVELMQRYYEVKQQNISFVSYILLFWKCL